MSLDSPVHVLAPGVELAAVEPALRRLAPIARRYRRVLAQVGWRSDRDDSPAALRALLAAGEVPVRWIYVGLAEGVMFSYPGKSGYPDSYDPRVRPWYRLGDGARSPRWGNAYIDLQGEGLVLPGVIGIYGDADRLLGVAGIELTFDYVIHALLAPSASDAIREVFLVDERGRIVIRSGQLAAQFGPGVLHEALELAPLPVPEVVAAIGRAQSGQHRRVEGGRDVLYAFQRIPSLGWYYVACADLDLVLAQ